MPPWLKRVLYTAASLVGVALCLLLGLFSYRVWFMSATRATMQGHANARRDAAHGRYRFLSAGLMAASDPNATNHSRDNYGIEYLNTGCVTTESSRAYQHAYNETMDQAVIAHFGHDVTKDTHRTFTYLQSTY